MVPVATLALSLVAVEASAITLPDTTSPCSTGSSDGCLKIANTDSTDYGSPAIYAITQSQFGTAVVANGTYKGVDASGGNIAVNATGTNIGVVGSGAVYGVNGTTTSTSGYGVYGENTATSGIGVYGTGNPGIKGVATAGLGINGIGSSGGVFGQATNYDTWDYGVKGNAMYGSGVLGSSDYGVGVTGDATVGAGTGVYGSTTGSGKAIYGDNSSSSGWAGYFNGKVYASAGFTSSDARLKKDVAALPYGLKDLAALRPITFKWKDPSRGDARNIGFVAQDLQKIVPELVDQDAKSGMLAVNYPGLVPVLVKAIQEQQAIIARQESRIQTLEQRPIVSSMFSGGINVSVAIGALGALVFNVIRRRKASSLNRDSEPTVG